MWYLRAATAHAGGQALASSGGPGGDPSRGSGPDEIFIIDDLEELSESAAPDEDALDARRRLAAALAERAKERVKEETGAQRKPSLADRARRRPKSALDAIAAARTKLQEESRAHERPAPASPAAPPPPAPPPRPAPPTPPGMVDVAPTWIGEDSPTPVSAETRIRRPAKPMPDPAPRTARPSDPLTTLVAESEVEELILRIAPGAEIQEVYLAIPRDVCVPLWRSHLVRARVDGDLAFAAAADRVLDALEERLEFLVATRVSFADTSYAVWLDLELEIVLAAAEPAELYLVGL